MSQQGPTFNCDRLSAPKGRLTSHLVVENRQYLTAVKNTGEKNKMLWSSFITCSSNPFRATRGSFEPIVPIRHHWEMQMFPTWLDTCYWYISNSYYPPAHETKSPYTKPRVSKWTWHKWWDHKAQSWSRKLRRGLKCNQTLGVRCD